MCKTRATILNHQYSVWSRVHRVWESKPNLTYFPRQDFSSMSSDRTKKKYTLLMRFSHLQWQDKYLRLVMKRQFRCFLPTDNNTKRLCFTNANIIGGFHVTWYQANFASHHTRNCHVGFLFTCDGIGESDKCSITFYSVYTTLPIFNRVTRISAHPLRWNFTFFREVNRKF